MLSRSNWPGSGFGTSVRSRRKSVSLTFPLGRDARTMRWALGLVMVALQPVFLLGIIRLRGTMSIALSTAVRCLEAIVVHLSLAGVRSAAELIPKHGPCVLRLFSCRLVMQNIFREGPHRRCTMSRRVQFRGRRALLRPRRCRRGHA